MRPASTRKGFASMIRRRGRAGARGTTVSEHRCIDTDGAFHGSECLLRVDFEEYTTTTDKPGYGFFEVGSQDPDRHPGKDEPSRDARTVRAPR